MLISILDSVMSLVQRVSTAQLPRNNVPIHAMLVVKVPMIGTSLYIPGPTT
jgi:hypothetical protein